MVVTDLVEGMAYISRTEEQGISVNLYILVEMKRIRVSLA